MNFNWTCIEPAAQFKSAEVLLIDLFIFLFAYNEIDSKLPIKTYLWLEGVQFGHFPVKGGTGGQTIPIFHVNRLKCIVGLGRDRMRGKMSQEEH